MVEVQDCGRSSNNGRSLLKQGAIYQTGLEQNTGRSDSFAWWVDMRFVDSIYLTSTSHVNEETLYRKALCHVLSISQLYKHMWRIAMEWIRALQSKLKRKRLWLLDVIMACSAKCFSCDPSWTHAVCYTCCRFSNLNQSDICIAGHDPLVFHIVTRAYSITTGGFKWKRYPTTLNQNHTNRYPWNTVPTPSSSKPEDEQVCVQMPPFPPRSNKSGSSRNHTTTFTFHSSQLCCSDTISIFNLAVKNNIRRNISVSLQVERKIQHCT